MTLVVDVGNSYSKFYVFNADDLIDEFKFTLDEINFTNFFKKYNSIKKAIISSVSNDDIVAVIRKKINSTIEFNHKTKISINILYETPKTLGLDRIAGVVGASHSFPNKNILIIDIGTAITYDFIDSKNNYYGGNISPGMQIRFKSLNTFTKKLPLVTPKESTQIIGKTTEMAIATGVQQGIIYEIEGYISHFENNYENLTVILTGGDCFFFEKRLKKSIFVLPNLVALGLNQILKLNV